MYNHEQEAPSRQEEDERKRETLDEHEEPKYDENYGMNHSQGGLSVPYEQV